MNTINTKARRREVKNERNQVLNCGEKAKSVTPLTDADRRTPRRDAMLNRQSAPIHADIIVGIGGDERN